MPVNYTPPTPSNCFRCAASRSAAAAAGIKSWTRDDVLLVAVAPGSRASGVFTQNRFCAAPVIVCREHLRARRTQTRALLINAGNANAGTGDAGLAAARRTCAAVAKLLGLRGRAKCCRFRPASSWSRCRSDKIVDALPRCAAALTRGRLVRGGARDHDHRHRAQGRVAPHRGRRRRRSPSPASPRAPA